MRLEQSFEVPVPVERAWEVLLDIERVAPCMPGATLTSHDGDAFTGNVKVKLGPVNLTYTGKGRFVEVDEAARRVAITASGTDSRGAGTAAANVTAELVAVDSRTRVDVVTELNITGRAAQFGRGLIGDVSGRLIGQFADCLAGTLAEGSQPDSTAPAPPTSPGVVSAGIDSAGIDSTGGVLSAGAAGGEPPPEAEAIDLFAVTGVGPAARRALPYLVTALIGLLVVLGVIRRVRRR